MFQGLQFDSIDLPEEAQALRREVRDFLSREMPKELQPYSDFNCGYDAEFSGKLGKQGWIGMTWPVEVGGGNRTFFERYVVTEELLAAGAPVSAHWIADRQSGPLLLRFGSPEQQQRYLPSIAAGECFFSIGMSEPDVGSDLASVRTKAERVEGGWVVNGRKVWTSGAQHNHYIIALVRTEGTPEDRHKGLSQVIIDLRGEGVTVRPIKDMSGEEDFNEVTFDDCFVPDADVVGEPGNGWEQVTSELSYERSGPERFLSAFRLFVEFIRTVELNPNSEDAVIIGRIAAHIMTLRRMSISVAGMLQNGADPAVEAALVKSLGNDFEKEVPEMVRLFGRPMRPGTGFRAAYEQTILHAPSFTLRGGTREILLGVIARGLGLR